MKPANLLHTSTFRYAVIYMAVFALSVCGVLAFLYWNTVAVIDAQGDDTIEAEIIGLAEQYKARELAGLAEVIRTRSAGDSGRRNLYLLTTPFYAPLVGNLTQWPVEAQGEPRWIDFRFGQASHPGARPQIARARTFLLPGGYHLLVGRDLTERTAFRKSITETLVWALLLTVILGLGGGYLLSRNFLRRIDAIGDSSRAILHGDLSQRMPLAGTDDEFDRLADNLNEMLDQIERLMDGMRGVADNIAHDLRSPISRLRGRLEMTLRASPDPDRYREALEKTIEETDGILETFNSLLAIALAESGALKDGFETLDLGALARDAAELYDAAAEQRGQHLTTEIGEECLVRGDRNLLSQAISNLLDNALTHTPDNGAIVIAVAQSAEGPELTVADNGPGIPEADRDRVLHRFARLDASRSTPGSGLGLSQVAATALLHEAALCLTDNEPGLRVSLRFQRPANI